MSIQALNWALAQDQIENSATRFVLLVLCNYANEQGQCYPSRKTIAQKTSLSVRSVQTHLNWLADNGLLSWANQRMGSRQSVNIYQVQGEPFALSDDCQSANPARQSANDDISQGEPFAQNTSEEEPPYKSISKDIGETAELTVELDDEFSGKKKSRSKNNSSLKQSDPRAKHPAILVIKGMMRRYPDKILWDKIISRFGESFDREKLQSCRVAWIERGYNPNATTWLNWYFDGIPVRNGVNGNGTYKQNGTRPTTTDRLRDTAEYLRANYQTEAELREAGGNDNGSQ